MKRRPPPDMPSLIPSPSSVTDCTHTSKLIAADDPRRDTSANDRWDLFEALPKFRAWACDPFTHTNGSRYRYAVVSRAPFPGLGWVCLVYTLPLRGELPNVYDESGGAFYDDADDHTEGAIEWASVSARAVKVRYFDSADGEERMARVFDLKKKRALPAGDPGVLDVIWKDTLVSLGYSDDEAHALALRPTPAPLSPELPGKLAAIKVLWRQPDTLSLYGIPYAMREGQSPYDLRRAHDEWTAPKPGHYGPHRIDLSDWIWLGTPGWWGSYSKADIAAIKAWLALPHVKANIPGNVCEWTTIEASAVEHGS